jgi:hypothetical protein
MDQIGKIIFSALPSLLRGTVPDPDDTTSWVSTNHPNPHKTIQLEYAFLHATLLECKRKLERAYGICNWLNPAIEICSNRMKEEKK